MSSYRTPVNVCASGRVKPSPYLPSFRTVGRRLLLQPEFCLPNTRCYGRNCDESAVLLIFSPAAVQGLFEEIAGQTDMDTILAPASRYGMEIVG